MKIYYFTLLVLAAISCNHPKLQKSGKEGKQLPEFNIMLVDSTIVNTRDISPGKPIVVFLFSPYCPYSKLEMQDIEDNAQLFKDILLYAITPFEIKDIIGFYNKDRMTKFSNVHIGSESLNYFGTYMKVDAVPYIAVYNRDRKLKGIYKGITDAKIIINEALK